VNVKIDISASKGLKKKLDKISKTTFPKVVKETLTKGAYINKTEELPKSGKQKFTTREPTFLKANTKYEKASGTTVNTMQSKTYAFQKPSPKAGKTAKEISNLDEQESGGKTKVGKFVPLKAVRVSGSYKKRIKPNARVKQLDFRKIVDVRKTKGRSNKQKFVRGVMWGLGKYGDGNFFVLGNRHKSGRTLSLINRVKKNGRSKIQIKRTPLYVVKKAGVYEDAKRTNFATRAAHESNLKMSDYYVKRAQQMFNKVMSR